MKKAILLLMITGLVYTAGAQNCTPDTTITEPGIYPEYLDTASVSVSYEHVLHILSLKDTMVIFGGNPVTATIDSIRIDSIAGLPGSFSYSCEPSRCVYTWENVGCAALRGTAVTGDIGVHPLDIRVTYFARVGSITIPVKDTIEGFSLVVEGENVGVEALNKGVMIAPNPSHTGVFRYHMENKVLEIKVFNQAGELVLSDNQGLGAGTIDLSDQSRGVYMVLIISDQGMIIQKLLY